MNERTASRRNIAGVSIRKPRKADRIGLMRWLEQHRLTSHLIERDMAGLSNFLLRQESADAWMPDSDTTGLCTRLGLNSATDAPHLEREILMSMLASPEPFAFLDFAELRSSVRVRIGIVNAARRTRLAFHTREAERPHSHWKYVEGKGFIVRRGCSLIEALELATQPPDDVLYSFSCYRASEYVILLALAREAASRRPDLYGRLQDQWEIRAIASRRFHETFLIEYGSSARPLPHGYYVPGDRIWFRNPDERSSDVEGYEGSWVFYLGNGQFSNFWQGNAPYTLTSKCVEIYHWRHGILRAADGTLGMDESLVASLASESLGDVKATERILAQMMRIRDPQGVYCRGGCIDATREYPRGIRPETAGIRLPVDSVQVPELSL